MPANPYEIRATIDRLFLSLKNANGNVTDQVPELLAKLRQFVAVDADGSYLQFAAQRTLNIFDHLRIVKATLNVEFETSHMAQYQCDAAYYDILSQVELEIKPKDLLNHFELFLRKSYREFIIGYYKNNKLSLDDECFAFISVLIDARMTCNRAKLDTFLNSAINREIYVQLIVTLENLFLEELTLENFVDGIKSKNKDKYKLYNEAITNQTVIANYSNRAIHNNDNFDPSEEFALPTFNVLKVAEPIHLSSGSLAATLHCYVDSPIQFSYIVLPQGTHRSLIDWLRFQYIRASEDEIETRKETLKKLAGLNLSAKQKCDLFKLVRSKILDSGQHEMAVEFIAVLFDTTAELVQALPLLNVGEELCVSPKDLFILVKTQEDLDNLRLVGNVHSDFRSELEKILTCSTSGGKFPILDHMQAQNCLGFLTSSDRLKDKMLLCFETIVRDLTQRGHCDLEKIVDSLNDNQIRNLKFEHIFTILKHAPKEKVKSIIETILSRRIGFPLEGNPFYEVIRNSRLQISQLTIHYNSLNIDEFYEMLKKHQCLPKLTMQQLREGANLSLRSRYEFLIFHKGILFSDLNLVRDNFYNFEEWIGLSKYSANETETNMIAFVKNFESADPKGEMNCPVFGTNLAYKPKLKEHIAGYWLRQRAKQYISINMAGNVFYDDLSISRSSEIQIDDIISAVGLENANKIFSNLRRVDFLQIFLPELTKRKMSIPHLDFKLEEFEKVIDGLNQRANGTLYWFWSFREHLMSYFKTPSSFINFCKKRMKADEIITAIQYLCEGAKSDKDLMNLLVGLLVKYKDLGDTVGNEISRHMANLYKVHPDSLESSGDLFQIALACELNTSQSNTSYPNFRDGENLSTFKLGNYVALHAERNEIIGRYLTATYQLSGATTDEMGISYSEQLSKLKAIHIGECDSYLLVEVNDWIPARACKLLFELVDAYVKAKEFKKAESLLTEAYKDRFYNVNLNKFHVLDSFIAGQIQAKLASVRKSQPSTGFTLWGKSASVAQPAVTPVVTQPVAASTSSNLVTTLFNKVTGRAPATTIAPTPPTPTVHPAASMLKDIFDHANQSQLFHAFMHYGKASDELSLKKKQILFYAWICVTENGTVEQFDRSYSVKGSEQPRLTRFLHETLMEKSLNLDLTSMKDTSSKKNPFFFLLCALELATEQDAGELIFGEANGDTCLGDIVEIVEEVLVELHVDMGMDKAEAADKVYDMKMEAAASLKPRIGMRGSN